MILKDNLFIISFLVLTINAIAGNPDTIQGNKLKRIELEISKDTNDERFIFQQMPSKELSVYEYLDYNIAIGINAMDEEPETDYGLRLVLFDINDSVSFMSKGAFNMWYLFPAFFELQNKQGLLILLDLYEEVYHGTWIYLLVEDKMNYIGPINLYSLTDEDSYPSKEIIEIYEKGGNKFRFVFNTDYLWELNEADSSYNKIPAKSREYYYDGKELKTVKIEASE